MIVPTRFRRLTGVVLGAATLLLPAAVAAQGATADGFGLVVNSSRAVLYASAGADFEDAARREAIATRDAIRRASANHDVSASTEMMPAAPRS